MAAVFLTKHLYILYIYILYIYIPPYRNAINVRLLIRSRLKNLEMYDYVMARY